MFSFSLCLSFLPSFLSLSLPPSSVLCHVYVSMDSYLSVRSLASVVAQGLLQEVAERLDVPLEELVLLAVTYPGGI